MSQAITHIKLALENTVMVRGANGPKESFEYAYKMESMLKRMLKEELLEIVNDPENMEKKLCEFIDKLE